MMMMMRRIMRRRIMRRMMMMMISCHLLLISCSLHNLHNGLEPNLNLNLNNHRVFSMTTLEDMLLQTNHTLEDMLLQTNHTAEVPLADGNNIPCTFQSLAAISILHYLHLQAIEHGPIDNNNTAVASSSEARDYSSAFDPELRFQRTSSLPVTLSTATAVDHQNDSQIAATAVDHYAVGSAKSLFGSFAWKGIGLCLRKSIISWNACGVSIRLPVTGNFPEYDNIVYYPRMTCFVGVAYPYSVYLTLSISLPSQTAMLPLLLLSNGTTRGSRGSSSSIMSLISRRTTDSVRRYGLSWSLKYDQQRGSHFSVGPSCSYVPGAKFVAILTHYMSYLSAQILLLLRRWTTRLSAYIGKVFNNSNTTATATTMSNAAAAAATRAAYIHMLCRSSFDYSQQIIRRILRWLERKSPLLATNLGIFASKHRCFGVSSNIILELQPFFFFLPLYKEMTRLLKKSYEHCYHHSSSSTYALPPTLSQQLQKNRSNQTENETETTAAEMMPGPVMSCA